MRYGVSENRAFGANITLHWHTDTPVKPQMLSGKGLIVNSDWLLAIADLRLLMRTFN
jgi:hypothetical protein